MPKTMPRYYVCVTVNTPTYENEYTWEDDSMDEIMRRVVRLHPECTSMVLSVVPNKDGIGGRFDHA